MRRSGLEWWDRARLERLCRYVALDRMRELQAELAEVQKRDDSGRAERARTEIDALTESLSSALVLGGRSRRLGDAAEKARTAVTWHIRNAVKRVEAAHSELGRHLENSVRTGTFCVYRPERVVRWLTLGAD